MAQLRQKPMIFYNRNGVHVVLDISCGRGGVIVSYFKMVQDFYLYFWDKSGVREWLDKKMAAAYHSVLNTSRGYNINMRRAACAKAAKCVVEAVKLHGWV